MVTLYHAKDLDIYIFRYVYIYIFRYLYIYIFLYFYVHTRWRVNRIDSYRYPTDRLFSICCSRKNQTVFNFKIDYESL